MVTKTISASELVKKELKRPKKARQIHDIEIVRGERMVIPETASINDCIQALQRKQEQDEQGIVISETIKTFVWEGAIALSKAIERLCGWVEQSTIKVEGFFGTSEIKPKMIQIDTGVNETMLVPWGQFTLPGIAESDCLMNTGTTVYDGRIVFKVTIECRKKYEKFVREIVQEARRIARDESIYRGKALKIRFYEEVDGNRQRIELPTPSFFDVSKVREEEVIFSDVTDTAIRTSIYTLLEHPEDCVKDGIPKKRGILLAGTYGTGKTLVAYITAQKATRAGRTFILCEKADELDEVVQFSRNYDDCVLFCEDIDRIVSGERTEDIDAKMNQIDGIESKGGNTLMIFTTNYVDKIYKGMIRPGRIDDTIQVTTPDATAVERLIRMYGKTRIEPDEDITEAVSLLTGNIPAVIQEVVERSKLYAIQSRNPGKIKGANLIHAAKSMQFQLELLNGKKGAQTEHQELLTKLSETGARIGTAVHTLVTNNGSKEAAIQ